MPEVQAIKWDFRNACLLKQGNAIGLLKLVQATGSAEILNILSGRECGGRQVKALYIIMCEVQSEHQMKNIEYTCIFI